jgi:hypothetical protein
MFIASGAIMMEAWNNFASRSDQLIISGILTFLNGLIYLADFALTYFKYR